MPVGAIIVPVWLATVPCSTYRQYFIETTINTVFHTFPRNHHCFFLAMSGVSKASTIVWEEDGKEPTIVTPGPSYSYDYKQEARRSKEGAKTIKRDGKPTPP